MIVLEGNLFHLQNKDCDALYIEPHDSPGGDRTDILYALLDNFEATHEHGDGFLRSDFGTVKIVVERVDPLEQSYRIQYSHDKERWFDYGPFVNGVSIPLRFLSVDRCREICHNVLMPTYAGHRWYQRILSQDGTEIERVHCD